MHRIQIDEVVYDSTIYPRSKWNTGTIKQYIDAMRGGDQFPPLVLEKGTNRLLDGVHRWKAHHEYLAEYQRHLEDEDSDNHLAPIDNTVEVEYHEVPDGIPIRLYAAGLSTRHGLRISPSDRKTIAREVYVENPDFRLEDLREYLGVSVGTAHNYVADIRAKREEERLMTAYRLHLLGWTQEEIGEVLGIVQAEVSQRFLSEFSKLKKVIKNLASGGLPYLDIAERHNMPLILVWATVLEGLNDQSRMEKLGINIQPYDVWNFSKCDDLFGDQHPGRIPGQLIAHVLYFFTKPGDVVIDPMSGSGTTQDICLAMGRKCYAYDIDQHHNRKDVIGHNIHADGWHDRIKKSNLLFWDPPYFRKKDKDYIEGSVSALSRSEYLEFFQQRLGEAFRQVKRGTRIAFLMSDWDDNTDQQEGLFVWDYANMLTHAGWKLIRHIQVPLSTQQVHPDIVIKFRQSLRLARLERYLLIGEKA